MKTKTIFILRNLFQLVLSVIRHSYSLKLSVLLFTFCFSIYTYNSFSQSVSIGEATLEPDASAMLDVSGTDKGVLINRMTTTERNSINLPANGLLIYNTDCNQFNYNAGTSTTPRWLIFAGFYAPQAIVSTNILSNRFTANWNAVADAVNYRIDVSANINFSSFIGSYNNYSVGDVFTYEVTGLSSGTTYYFRIRAENSCGLSGNSNIISTTTIY